jgi:hypothetical protein
VSSTGHRALHQEDGQLAGLLVVRRDRVDLGTSPNRAVSTSGGSIRTRNTWPAASREVMANGASGRPCEHATACRSAGLLRELTHAVVD